VPPDPEYFRHLAGGVAYRARCRFARSMPELNDTSSYLEELAKWRSDRDDFLANHYATPLADEAIVRFTGIRYFEPDPALVFDGCLVEMDSRIEIESSTGSTSQYPAAGTVDLPLSGGSSELWVLHGEDGELFLPFRDATSGMATYSGGRYVVVTTAEGSVITVDFNRATNPYCAYDPDFSCPLPPAGNRLMFAIEAGEMDYR
jgi:uncharacterized protein (DUF1684 family)